MNSHVKNVLITANAVVTSLASKKQLDGQDHLVVPVIAIKTGVLNGTYYSKEEIQAFAQAWNGVPVPVNHPKNGDTAVSANSPEFENTVNIGKLFNVNYERGKLKGEIWINNDKAKRLGYESILDHFAEGKMMEVSTGLYSEIYDEPGIFNNQKYSFVARNIRPDHLALLPNEEGACSLEDGCGAMRTNEKDCGCDNPSIGERFIGFIRNTFGFHFNESAHNEIFIQLLSLIRGSEKNSNKWVEDVYDNFFVYKDGEKLYKQSYSEDKGIVRLQGNATRVVRKVSYDAVLGNSSEENDMSFDKSAAVDALIANEATQYTEDDKELLMSLDDQVVEKMAPVVNDKSESESEPEKAPATAELTNNSESGTVLSPEDAALFANMKANEQARQDGLRKQVVDGYASLTTEVVANMAIDAVEKLAADIKPAADYSARGGAGAGTTTANQKPYKPAPVLLANAESSANKQGANNGES